MNLLDGPFRKDMETELSALRLLPGFHIHHQSVKSSAYSTKPRVSARKCALHRSVRAVHWMSSSRAPTRPAPANPVHFYTHIQNNGDASPRFRSEELLLSHGHLLLTGGVLPAGDVLVVAHFGDDPADEPVDSTGLGAAVSGLRCRCGLAVLTGYGFRLLAAFLGSKFGLFFVQQFVDSVPTVARCLLTHPFAAERSCCALWGRENPHPHPSSPLTSQHPPQITPTHPTEPYLPIRACRQIFNSFGDLSEFIALFILVLLSTLSYF